MKKKGLSVLLVIVLAVVGLSLLLYPMIANMWNSYRQSQLLTTYEETVEEEDVDYDLEYEKAVAYNNNLQPMILPDSFAVADANAEAGVVDNSYMSCLNLSNDEYGTMGYVEIPKIDVKIPIFHTTDEDVLERGAGHLEGSSLPVGGESTHAVIAAHRGLPSASLFTDLDKLEIGDHFLIYVLDKTLCYEVDQINVIDPEDTSLLNVEEGEDLVTLLTCTPYGVNTQRLLVRGHRVDYTPEVEKETLPITQRSLHTSYGLWVVVGLAIAGIFILILWLRERKYMKKLAEKRAAEAAAAEALTENNNSEENADTDEPANTETAEDTEKPDAETESVEDTGADNDSE